MRSSTRRILRFAAYAAVSLSVIAAILSAGIWAGMNLREALNDRTSVPFRAKYKIEGYYNSIFRKGRIEVASIETNRLRLQVETTFLPVSAADYAGGITVIDGRSILLLDRLGSFFLIDGSKISKLELAPPRNYMNELKRQIESGDLGPIKVDYKHFRYNDTLFLRHDGRAHILASYTEWSPENRCYVSALARLQVDGSADPRTWTAGPDDWVVIKRTTPCLRPFTRQESPWAIKALEAAGRLADPKDGSVLWTSGAYEWDDAVIGPDYSSALGQDPSTDYGKVLRVDFQTGETRHVASGLRNPQGITIDALNRVWVTDHGMRGGDELNLVFEGANFGFPVATYGTRYDKTPAGFRSKHTDVKGFDEPVIAFVPSIAPGAAIAVEGFHYAWDGNILIGAFDGSIYRVQHDDGQVRFVEPIRLGVRSRDMDRLADGRIAIWTDDRRVLFLSPDSRPAPEDIVREAIAGLPDEATRVAVGGTFEACQQCHGLSDGEHGAGPHLFNICARRLGASDFENYSGALRRAGGSWDADRLAAFIENPESVAPGSSMAWGGLESRDEALTLARLICSATKPQ